MEELEPTLSAASMGKVNEPDADESIATHASKSSRNARTGTVVEMPRRFKTAYILFSSEKHKEVRQSLGKQGKSIQTPEISQLVGRIWLAMTPAEKSEWEEKARKDKERYHAEMECYKVSTTDSSGERFAAAPKRPMSAYLAFSNKRRAAFKQQNPGLTNGELSKLLAKAWKEAPPDVRAEYIDKEAKLREVYKLEITPWRCKKIRNKRSPVVNDEDNEDNKNTIPPICDTKHHPQSLRLNHFHQGASLDNTAFDAMPHHLSTNATLQQSVAQSLTLPLNAEPIAHPGRVREISYLDGQQPHHRAANSLPDRAFNGFALMAGDAQLLRSRTFQTQALVPASTHRHVHPSWSLLQDHQLLDRSILNPHLFPNSYRDGNYSDFLDLLDDQRTLQLRMSSGLQLQELELVSELDVLARNRIGLVNAGRQFELQRLMAGPSFVQPRIRQPSVAARVVPVMSSSLDDSSEDAVSTNYVHES